MHLFLRAKKESSFASAYLGEWQIFENFVSTYLCGWQVFENFQFIDFSTKGKRIRKKQLNQGTFGWCFCQDQRKDKQVTIVKLLLLIDSKKSWINQKILCIFFYFCEFIFAKYEFSAYLECIYFRECLLKESFACI